MEYFDLDRNTFKNVIQEFADLYTLCFNVPMNSEEVSWRYLDNPNEEILSCIAVDKGKLIANYSASPVRLIYNGQIIKVALSLNTMTHPDYIGQGLFVNLASKVYNYMYENGYQMIFGFPNNISNRTFLNKLGWKDIRFEPTLQIDLKQCRKKGLDSGLIVFEDDDFSLDYHYTEPSEGIAVYKPKEYLVWRFAHHPAVKYYNFVICGENDGNVTSRVIVKEFRDKINIVDSFFSNAEELFMLIDHVIEFGRSHGKQVVTLWAQMGSWEHLLIESYGAILTTPITYFGANVFGEEVIKEDFYDPKLWRLNMCDDNVY